MKREFHQSQTTGMMSFNKEEVIKVHITDLYAFIEC